MQIAFTPTFVLFSSLCIIKPYLLFYLLTDDTDTYTNTDADTYTDTDTDTDTYTNTDTENVVVENFCLRHPAIC